MGKKKESQLLSAASALAAFSASVAFHLIHSWDNNSSWNFCGILVLSGSLLTAVVCVDIWRLQPADSHTLETLLSQYIAITKLRVMAPFVRKSINQMTRQEAQKTTTKTLLSIIRSNQETEYGRKYRFSEIQSIEDYTRLHPLTTYEHYRPMIDRIMAGECNILHQSDTVYLALTSGTTGTPKFYPLTGEYIKQVGHNAKDVMKMNSLLPLTNMKRCFSLHLFADVHVSSGAIPIGPISQRIYSFPKHNLIPTEYQKLNKEDSSFYVMAVFALAEKELSYIDSFSADLVNAFMKFMVKHWENICHGIETGTIGKEVEMPDEIRVSLSTHLRPDPDRANSLREVLKKGLVGLARRVRPDIDYIIMAKSGGFKMLSKKLIENHFKGVKVIGYAHSGSEGLCGINLETDHREGDTEEVFTFFPTFCFKEFIPLEVIEEKDPKAVQLHQLEVGKYYEVVMTNMNALYRCRYGDIIKVVGYANNIPRYEFAYRLGQQLNISLEKTPESFLIRALQRAKSSLNIKSDITDFTTTESTVTEEITGEYSKGHYVFFIEFDEKLESVSDLAREIDQDMVDSYELYRWYKYNESIGDLEVMQVKPGNMEAIRGILMGDELNPQFKMPRVLRKLPAIKYLIDNRMTNYSHSCTQVMHLETLVMSS